MKILFDGKRIFGCIKLIKNCFYVAQFSTSREDPLGPSISKPRKTLGPAKFGNLVVNHKPRDNAE